MSNQKPLYRADVWTWGGDYFRLSNIGSYSSSSPLATPVHTAVVSIRGLYLEGKIGDVSNKKIRDVIKNNDLIKIRKSDSNGDDWIDMIGSVLRVLETEAEVDGAPEKRTEIHIESIAKELMDYVIFWHPHIAGKNNLGGVGWLARGKGKLQKGRPDQVIKSLYDTFINDDYIMRLADSRKLNESLTLNLDEIKDSYATTALSALGGEQDLWSLISRYSDQPWNELFVSMQHEKAERPSTSDNKYRFQPSQYADKMGVYLRPTPFDPDSWEKLKNTWGWGFEFDESERIGSGVSIGREEGEVYNFFWVSPKAVYTSFDALSVLFTQSGGQLPIYDAELIKKYGLRKLEKSTEYVQYVKKQDKETGTIPVTQKRLFNTKAGSLWELLVKRSIQLYRWFGYEEFWRGSITLRGRIGGSKENGIRQGGILRRKSDGMEFYITSVSQNYEYPGPDTTTIEVTRGHYPQKYAKWWADTEKKMQDKRDISTNLTEDVLKKFGIW